EGGGMYLWGGGEVGWGGGGGRGCRSLRAWLLPSGRYALADAWACGRLPGPRSVARGRIAAIRDRDLKVPVCRELPRTAGTASVWRSCREFWHDLRRANDERNEQVDQDRRRTGPARGGNLGVAGDRWRL